MTASAAIATETRPYPGLRAAGPALLVGILGLGLLFWREVKSAVEVWDASTAYNHCFLVLPIALWMAWERRARLVHVPARPVPLVALAALPCALAWFVADRIGIMEGRQLAAMGMLQVLFLAVLGWDLWRRLSAPLLYLVFLVPFGAFLTPVLQDFTAAFTLRGLNLLGILYFSDGYTIELTAGTFYVAEACAGLRFLIASVAFGTLYACTIYRSPFRRVVFIGVSIVVPIIANGFRALGIVVAGHYLGSAEAAAADHVIYGWGFFSFVTLLLILIGLPFRQDRDPEPEEPPATGAPPGAIAQDTPRGFYPAMAGVLALGLLAPGAAALLDRAATPPAFAGTPDLGGDCRPVATPARTLPVTASIAYLDCANDQVRVAIAVFPGRVNPGQIIVAQRYLSGEAGGGETDVGTLANRTGPRWRLLERREPFGSGATALWIDGTPARLGLSTRIQLARDSMLGAAHPPVLVGLTPAIDWAQEGGAGRARARQVMTRFLDQRPDLPDRIAAMAAAAKP